MTDCNGRLAAIRSAIVLIAVVLSLNASAAFGQTTAFTYQGKLNDGAAPANGPYDLSFRLFDTLAGGAQQGAALRLDDVQVTNGIFTVTLDFGISVFPGADRFLEIGVRPGASGGAFTTLSPRQQITSTPYSVRSMNASTADGLSAACAGCVTAAQIGGVNGSAVNGVIPVASVPAGSGNYVQNTTTQQTASNFNISGDGTAGGTLAGNIVNATSQYNIDGNRVLSVAGTNNTFAGASAGAANTTGAANSFFGSSAGIANTNGNSNSFFGVQAGDSNTTGDSNSFFGALAGANNNGNSNSFFGSGAGLNNTSGSVNSFFGFGAGDSNTTGSNNSFFGAAAGSANTNGFDNSFFGRLAGFANTGGDDNSFFGANAGDSNTTGGSNSFFGSQAGDANTTGSFNSFFGIRAGRDNTAGTFNSFFGSDAGANATGGSNSFFGSGAGEFTTTGVSNSFFGRSAGSSNNFGASNSFFGDQAGQLNSSGSGNSFLGSNAGNTNTTGNSNTIIGNAADVGSGDLSHATAIGAGAVVQTSNAVVLGRATDDVFIPGHLVVLDLGTAGATSLCRNASNQISTCSSSLRYKTAVQSFFGGLNIVRRLRPIAFIWKEGGMRDVGFAAEDVAKVEPLLTTRNTSGEIEGVKYDQLTAVLVNAVKEQQEIINAQQKRVEQQEERFKRQEEMLQNQQRQIAAQQQTLTRQQREIENLKKLFAVSRSALSRHSTRRK